MEETTGNPNRKRRKSDEDSISVPHKKSKASKNGGKPAENLSNDDDILGLKVKIDNVVVEGADKENSVVPAEQTTDNSDKMSLLSILNLLKVQQTRSTGLKKLLISFKQDEERVEVVKNYLKISPECKELFNILEGEERPSTQVAKLVWDIFESILLTTSDEKSSIQSSCLYISNRILSKHMKQIYSALNSSTPADLTKAVLRLLTAILAQGKQGVFEVLTSFDFTLKALESLPRRRDRKAKVDVRTAYIRFCLAFLMFGDTAASKQVLELQVFANGFFNGLSKDPPETVHLVLSTVKDKVIHRAGLLKKTKLTFFNSHNLMQLAYIYVAYNDNTSEEDKETSELQGVVSEMIFQIFKVLCTDSESGICFTNQQGALAGRSNNPVLLKFLRSLQKLATSQPKLQSLISQTLSNSPDLIIPYISAVGINLEPRMSTPWINNIDFLIEIWSNLPSPVNLLEDVGHFLSATNLPLVMKLVFPTAVTKSILINGLKQNSLVVKQRIIDMMLICVKRAVPLLTLIRSKEGCEAEQIAAMEENFLDLVFKQLPEASAIVAVRHSLKSGTIENKKEGEEEVIQKDTDADLGEASPESAVDELMKFYQQMRPGIFSNSDFNICKLFKSKQDADALNSSVLLHSIEIALMEPFGSLKWFSKKSDVYTTALQLIFAAYLNTSSPEIRAASKYLIIKLLNETGSMNENLDEIRFWLESLSLTFEETKDSNLATFFHRICSVTVNQLYSVIDEITEISIDDVGSTDLDSDDLVLQSSNIHSERIEFSPLVVGSFRFFLKNLNENKNNTNLASLARFLTHFLMGKLMSMQSPACLLRIIHKYTQLISEQAGEDPGWLNELMKLKQFAFQWCSCIGIAVEISEAKSEQTSKKIHDINFAKDNTFPSIIREVFPTSLKKLNKLSNEFMEKFKSRLTQSLKYQTSERNTIFNSIRIILNCVSNMHKIWNKESFGICYDLLCFFGKLILESVIVYQESGPAEKDMTYTTEKHDAYGQDLGNENNFNDLVSSVLDFQIFKVNYLSSKFGKAFSWLTDFLKVVLSSIENNGVLSYISCYFKSLTDAFQPALTGKKDPAYKVDKSELLRAVDNFVKYMLDQELFKLIQAIINSLKSQKCGEEDVEFLIDALTILLRKHEINSASFANPKSNELKLGLKKESESSSETHGDNFGNAEPKSNKSFSILQEEIDGESHEQSNTNDSQNDYIEDLFCLLAKISNKKLENVILDLIKVDKTMAVCAPTAIIDSCMNDMSSERVEIVSFLVRSSPLHAKRLLEKLGKLEEYDDVTLLIPVFHALFVNSSPVIRRKSNSLLQKKLDEILSLMTNKDSSSSLKGNESELLMEILIILGSSSKNKDQILSSLVEMMEGMQDSTSVGSKSRHQLMLFDALVMPNLVDNKEYIVALKVLTSMMRMLEKALLKEGNRCIEEVIHMMIAKMCDILSSEANTKWKSNDIEAAVERWTSLLKVALKSRIQDSNVVSTLRLLITNLYSMKAFKKKSKLALETIYTYILSHSQFLPILMDEQKDSKNKECLIELLLKIAEMVPAVCESSHLQAFLAAYNATMSSTDQKLLQLLQVYENNGISMLHQRPLLWGKEGLKRRKESVNTTSSLYNSPVAKDIMEMLDRNMLLKSAYNFPLSIDITDSKKSITSREDIYHPTFLLPVFSFCLRPDSEIDIRKFIETGCLAFVIAALSCDQISTRRSAYHVLARFMQHFEGARFRERNQVAILLDLLKNAITEEGMQLPFITCCFVMRCLQILLRTDQHLYPIINNFLLQKPCLDTKELPLLLPMLNSSNLQYSNERAWILKLLLSGLRSAADYYIYKRRHVFELLMSLYDSPLSDNSCKKPITDLLLSASVIHPAAFDLVKNYGLLSWVSSTFREPVGVEFGIQILHNLMDTFKHGFKSSKEEDEGETKKPIPQNFTLECIMICVSILDTNSVSLGLLQITSLLEVILWCIENSSSVIQVTAYISRDHINNIIHHCNSNNNTGAVNTDMTALMNQYILQVVSIWVQQRIKILEKDASKNFEFICSIFPAVCDIFRRVTFDRKSIATMVDIAKHTALLLSSLDIAAISSAKSTKNVMIAIFDILVSSEHQGLLKNKPTSTIMLDIDKTNHTGNDKASALTENASSTEGLNCPIMDEYTTTCSQLLSLRLELFKILLRLMSGVRDDDVLENDGAGMAQAISAFSKISKESHVADLLKVLDENKHSDVAAIMARNENFFECMHILAMEIRRGRKVTDHLDSYIETIDHLKLDGRTKKLKRKGKKLKSLTSSD